MRPAKGGQGGPDAKKTSLSLLVAVVLALLVWWLETQGGLISSSDQPADAANKSPGQTSSVIAAPTPTPTPTSTSTPTIAPSSSTPTRGATSARPSTSPTNPDTDDSGLPTVQLAALPPEAAETVRLIDAGGPYPYPPKDGSTFGNYEGLLPHHESGYYREFTVPTPGERDRGARRIIAGDAGELYWTADHYESFERIIR